MSLLRVGAADAGRGVIRTAAVEVEAAAAAAVIAVSLLSIAGGETGGVKSVWSVIPGVMRTVLECGIERINMRTTKHIKL